MASEKRLIDANALKANVQAVSTHYLNDWSTIGVLAAVDKQPTVDAVEVVRCKDCKHCIYISYACGDVRCGKLHTDFITENSFCSYGERREGE